MSLKTLCLSAAIATAFGLTSQAQAQLATFTGADNGVSSLSQMTNSQAAESSFLAAAPGLNTITFESPLPSGVSVSGGSITNNSGCGALCGFNTTLGGQNFYLLNGGSGTFTFATPVDAFGFYVTGLQTNLVAQETVTFFDGTSQTINTPAAINGGGAFIGFTDIGKSITSVSFNATNDIVALDDVQFGNIGAAPGPTPGTGLLSFVALILTGVVAKRREFGWFLRLKRRAEG
jgi:hypothetical protein